MDYTAYDAYDLLEALELSGRRPDPDLIREILARGDQVVPGLLEMLGAEPDESWAEEDPRWYREIHAGLLLIELRATEALPLFEEILVDEEREEGFGEWFNTRLWRYGADIVPMLRRVIEDDSVPTWSRIAGMEILTDAAARADETRDEVVAVLRGQLPPLRDDGTLDVPDVDAVEEDDVDRWTFALLDLAELNDRESIPLGKALYEAGLVDESVVGDLEAYLDVYEQKKGRLVRDVDLLTFYEHLERPVLPGVGVDEGEVMEALREQMLAAGMAPEEVDRIIAQSLEQGAGQQAEEMLEDIRARLRAAGVPEDQLEQATSDVMERIVADPSALIRPPETFVNEQPKIGRNERVTIENPESGERVTLKYKHAEAKLRAGWQIVGV